MMNLEEILEKALKRLVRANAGLSREIGGKTLYERSPVRCDDACTAWQELNDAVKQAKVALQAAQIKRDPDVETEAGQPLERR